MANHAISGIREYPTRRVRYSSSTSILSVGITSISRKILVGRLTYPFEALFIAFITFGDSGIYAYKCLANLTDDAFRETYIISYGIRYVTWYMRRAICIHKGARG